MYYVCVYPSLGVRNLCESVRCDYGSICKVSVDNLSTKCICPEPDECLSYGNSLLDLPVCGSDGNDYDNECSLRSKACNSWTNISISHIGKCSEQDIMFVTNSACHTPYHEQICAACGVCDIFIDPCADVMCPVGQSCEVNEFYEPSCRCVQECIDDSGPVCGTDNRIYDNECLLRYTACIQGNSTITVAYYGQCKFGEHI